MFSFSRFAKTFPDCTNLYFRQQYMRVWDVFKVENMMLYPPPTSLIISHKFGLKHWVLEPGSSCPGEALTGS